MKKSKFLCGLLFLSALSFTACVEGNDDDDNNGGNGGNDPGLVSGVMKDLDITGHVYDAQGNKLYGVNVTSGTSEVTTNESGMFAFSKIDVVDNRSVVRFTKEGYFDVVRSLPSEPGEWEVVMCKKGNGEISSTNSFSSGKAQTISVGDMRIDMPADGYMVDENGNAYKGTVKTDMVYLDPNNENFAEMMPGGDLAATRTDGSSAMLVSYGMTAVNMTSETGEKLQLKEGAKAKLTFPIPEGMEENLPASIPLWSFNESNGLWEEEGVAHLQGNVYVGEVSHFSWVNLDYPEEQAKVKGYVRNDRGHALSGIRVNVGQISVATDSKGYYETAVPAETAFEIMVTSANYYNYRNLFARPVPALEVGEEREINITLPTLHNITGRIVNKGGGSTFASIWIEYGNNKRVTKAVTSNRKDGKFAMYAPDGYTGAATLFVVDNEGNTLTKPIEIINADMSLGDIVISTEMGDGGFVDIQLADGKTISLEVPNNAGQSGMNGVVVIDGNLTYIQEDEDAPQFYLELNGYEDGKNTYDKAKMFVGNQLGTEQFYADGTANANVVEKNNKFVFNLSGTGTYMSLDMYEENAKFNSEGLTLDMLFKGNTMRNIEPLKSGFPSFTPVLSQKAPLAMHIKNAKFCSNGGIIFYKGTSSDYEALKTMAKKSGVKFIDEDKDEEYAEAMFYSNKKYIMIEYDSTIKDIEYSDNFFDIESPIRITVFDNLDESMLGDFMSTASLAKTMKSSAKKRFKRLR